MGQVLFFTSGLFRSHLRLSEVTLYLSIPKSRRNETSNLHGLSGMLSELPGEKICGHGGYSQRESAGWLLIMAPLSGGYSQREVAGCLLITAPLSLMTPWPPGSHRAGRSWKLSGGSWSTLLTAPASCRAARAAAVSTSGDMVPPGAPAPGLWPDYPVPRRRRQSSVSGTRTQARHDRNHSGAP